jgi:ubiquinone/menaquinone biosynthesis C-methylase UbiE
MNERVYSREIEQLRSPERREKLEAEKIADLIANESINSLIDIGTGSGLFAEEFSKRNIKVIGIDSNSDMIEAAKSLVPGVEFHVASAEALPFDDKTFDTAFMGVVFHEVDDYMKTLQEARRVSVKAVYILEWKYINEDFGPPLEHRLSREFIEQQAVNAGFTKVEVNELKNLVLYKLK